MESVFDWFTRKENAAASAGLMMSLMAGCASAPDHAVPGYADNQAGRSSAAKMCTSMRVFTRASLDSTGLRRAWFLPLGVYDEGSFDFYAPMGSEPHDKASTRFYQGPVHNLTHYVTAPELGEALASCFGREHGYARLCQSQSDKTFRASFKEVHTGRAIEISSVDDVTSVLIAHKTWKGNLEDALKFRPDDETTQPTCQEPASNRGNEPQLHSGA